MVYVWCGEDNSSDAHDRKQRDNHELKYSLRSVWKYARWIHRVYILINTDKAAPSWLRSPGLDAWIRVIDRCDLFSNSLHCPTLNGHAAYTVAHRVPGLSNHFILMDDDIFLSHPVEPTFWFDPTGKPIVRTMRKPQPVYPPGTELQLPPDTTLRIPPSKWNTYHHRVSPARVDLVREFEAAFPGYHEFVQSHSESRFGPTNTAEEMPMLWYQAWSSQGSSGRSRVIDRSLAERCAFYTFWGASTPFLPRKARLRLQFISFWLVRSICAFRSFNVQDEWSEDPSEREGEVRLLASFLETLYPEVPWFERPSPMHSRALEPVKADFSVASSTAPSCLGAGALPFAVHQSLVSEEELAQVRMHAAEIALGPNDGQDAWLYFEYDNATTLNRIEHFVPRSAFFRDLAADMLRRACGSDRSAAAYTLFKDKINMKPVHGDPFKAHQDIAAGWDKYAPQHFTIALPFHNSSVGSGGLFLADSGGRRLAANNIDLTESHLSENLYHPVSMRAGDALIFDSLAPHFSLPNYEESARPILYFTYIEGPSRYDDYYADKLEAVPPDALKVPGKLYRSGNTHDLRSWQPGPPLKDDQLQPDQMILFPDQGQDEL